MSEQTAQEPTMEEILASIRRIISEDDAPPAAAAPEPEPEVELVAAPTPAPAAPEEDFDDDVLELTDTVDAGGDVQTVGDLDVYTPARPEPEPAWNPQPEPEPAFAADPAPAAAAFVPSGDIRIHGDMTITELVRVILEPQLKQWADENLDDIVRSVLREKLERVFR